MTKIVAVRKSEKVWYVCELSIGSDYSYNVIASCTSRHQAERMVDALRG